MDCEKLAPFIKKFLKNAVADGKLLQTKGKGASGSFKLSAAKKEGAEKKKFAKPKAKPAAEKAAPKKVVAPKKPAAPKKTKK